MPPPPQRSATAVRNSKASASWNLKIVSDVKDAQVICHRQIGQKKKYVDVRRRHPFRKDVDDTATPSHFCPDCHNYEYVVTL